jgi:DNA-3-methyladenine glycosylase
MNDRIPRSWKVAAGGVLVREFYGRPAVEVAPELLGCVLRSRSADGEVAVVLVEVEAYAGLADPASHAFRGPTARNAVMFGPPGHAYVYFTYGMHFCVNLVCQPAGDASAVLVRAGQVIEGAELAAARRGAAGQRAVRRGTAAVARPDGAGVLAERNLARGPARLCQALGIDRSLDGTDVCAPGSVLTVSGPPGGVRPDRAQIAAGPRVGVSRAADVPWRFWLAGERSVSEYRPAQRRSRAKPGSSAGAGGGTMHR